MLAPGSAPVFRFEPCARDIKPAGATDMGRSITIYIIVAALFVAIDALYLFSFGVKMFRSTLGDVMASEVNVPAGIVFYLLFPVGLLIFALWPAMAADRWTVALIQGALFGFFAYATYDLTNLATIRNWTTTMALVDMAWGTVLGGLVSTLAFVAQRAIFAPG